jgi:hypothetical protein
MKMAAFGPAKRRFFRVDGFRAGATNGTTYPGSHEIRDIGGQGHAGETHKGEHGATVPAALCLFLLLRWRAHMAELWQNFAAALDFFRTRDKCEFRHERGASPLTRPDGTCKGHP